MTLEQEIEAIYKMDAEPKPVVGDLNNMIYCFKVYQKRFKKAVSIIRRLYDGLMLTDLANQILEEDNKSLKERILRLEARQAWQPIETAPKDGTPIMVGCFNPANSWACNTLWDADKNTWFQLGCSAKILTHWKPINPPKEV